MTDEQILYKAIKKAEKNGYRGHMCYLPMFLKRDPSKKKKLSKRTFMQLMSRIWFMNKETIIFSHEFAKAFFPKDSDYYHYHLQMMVIKKNPIEYLEKFL